MSTSPHALTLTTPRRPLAWLAAALGSLVLNLGLFALMPHLLHPSAERPVFDKLIPRINVIRLKRPEPPVERQEARLPEPVRPKTAPPPPPNSPERIAPAEFKLAFEINPRLGGGPAVAPPVKVADFDHLALPAMVAAAELDRPLVPLSRMPPVYPMSAKRRGIEGWVRVRFVVDEGGNVQEVTVVAAQPAGVFDEAVTRCVHAWRFQPGTVDGTAVKTWAETTIRFKLE